MFVRSRKKSALIDLKGNAYFFHAYRYIESNSNLYRYDTNIFVFLINVRRLITICKDTFISVIFSYSS